jgi:hypothetical protein
MVPRGGAPVISQDFAKIVVFYRQSLANDCGYLPAHAIKGAVPLTVSHAAAAALVLYGALVIASSQLHPTFKKDASAAMPAEIQMKMPGSGSAPAIK